MSRTRLSLCTWEREWPGTTRPNFHDDDFLVPPFSIQVYVTYGATLATCPSLASKLYTPIIPHLSFRNETNPVRFDIYFLPGKNTDAVVDHYHAEGRACNYSNYVTKNESKLYMLSRENWETEGIDMVTFDLEEWHLQELQEEIAAYPGHKSLEHGIYTVHSLLMEPSRYWVGFGAQVFAVALNSLVFDGLKQEYMDAVQGQEPELSKTEV